MIADWGKLRFGFGRSKGPNHLTDQDLEIHPLYSISSVGSSTFNALSFRTIKAFTIPTNGIHVESGKPYICARTPHSVAIAVELPYGISVSLRSY